MGRQARLRDLRRVMRNRVAIGLTSAPAAASIDRRVRSRSPIPGRVLESAKPEDARNFYVGMSVSGPPEAFGLPPDPGCAAHATGTPGCTACYPPRAPVTVTAVDYEAGTITLSTAAP
jgi:hypothetical protein